MFKTALFTIAKQPKCSSIDGWRKEMWYTAAAKWFQSCLTLCDPMNHSPPDFSFRRILQARILEWVAISSSQRSSWPRDQTHISYIQVHLYHILDSMCDIIWQLSFSAWHTSLSMTISRSIHVATNGITSFFFIVEYTIFHDSSVGKESTSNARDPSSFPGSEDPLEKG